jgi:L-lactate dehydrogenase complex protein LldG
MAMTEMGEDRETFLRRIRASLEHDKTTAPAEAPPAVDEQVMRLASASDDLLERFAECAERIGFKLHRISAADLANTLARVCDEQKIQRMVIGVSEAVDTQLHVTAGAQAHQLEIVDWQSAGDMSPQFEVDAGLTDVHAAFAETGTLVCCTDGQHGRGLSLAPPIHIALVRASDILPDMIDYWHRFSDGQTLPSSQAFITGPSKTADIEGELVTGVHGPGQVRVLLIEDA